MKKNSLWEIIEGNLPVLLVASHNYPHFRKGLIKPRDIGTGDLVRVLCNKYNCRGIVSTGVQLDPNWYKGSLFREQIKKIISQDKIKIVIDLHGRRENYPTLIEFFPNTTFREKYFKFLQDKTVKEFKKDRQLTLTEDLGKKHISCLEVEIRKDGRFPVDQENLNYNYVLDLLGDLILQD